ncbi:MAG: hypothetical protein Q4D65_05490 [Peptostreptococcaceae bacterium]|nr:hypothetical protein [Peptostreptococcaceae bacterium]
MKRSKFILLAILVLAVCFIGYKNTYQGKFSKSMYFHKRFEKTEDAFLDTKMFGDLITFGMDEISIVEVRDVEAMRQEAKQKGGADIFPQGMKYDAPVANYKNPKYNPITKEITADELQESIKFIGNNQVEYKGNVFTIETQIDNVMHTGK